MANKIQGPMSGFRDFLADQMIPRQKMIDTIKQIYERYGFVPLDTPALEKYETLTGKYGEEGEKLMYKFKDNGDRMIAMRYDLTVPLARVVAQYQEVLPVPYKRYQVGNVWRGESPQAGRFREFMQFDADIVGTKSPVADAEIVMMMSDTMEALKVKAVVRVNNRKILDGLVIKSKIKKEMARELISAIDKAEKTGKETALQNINDIFGSEVKELIVEYLNIVGTNKEKLQKVQWLLSDVEEAKEGIANLVEVFDLIKASGYSEEKIVFDPTIARGLDYYTGIIYETTFLDLPSFGSVCSGGRFDNLVETLGGPDMPAVGTSVGVDRLFSALQNLGRIEEVKTKTRVLIVNFDSSNMSYYLDIATKLRREGVPAEIYYDQIPIKKQISFADKIGAENVLFLGSDEIKEGVGLVKNMITGEQTKVSIEKLTEFFKK